MGNGLNEMYDIKTKFKEEKAPKPLKQELGNKTKPAVKILNKRVENIWGTENMLKHMKPLRTMEVNKVSFLGILYIPHLL